MIYIAQIDLGTIISGIGLQILGYASAVVPVGLSIWGVTYGIQKVKQMMSEAANDGDDNWKEMVNDADGLYKHQDGSIRDKETDEVIFKYQS